MPDVDVDLANRDDLLKIIKHIPARLDNRKHNTGVYAHRVPVNPETGLCVYDYKDADEEGFFKLDLLNVSIYRDVRDEEHLKYLVEREPIWELLQHEEFVDQLFHLSGHVDILKKNPPSSIEQLAAVLAMIRPSKRYLIDLPWRDVFQEVWIPPANGSYYFKKSHAHSYAMAVVVHMNLLCEQLGY